MSMLDQIRGTVRAGSVSRTPDWGMRRDMLSQSYTTRIDQLWKLSSRKGAGAGVGQKGGKPDANPCQTMPLVLSVPVCKKALKP